VPDGASLVHTRVLRSREYMSSCCVQELMENTFVCVVHLFEKMLVSVVLMSRVGQNRIYTPYMTVYLVISLPKIPYIHRIYMVLTNPTYVSGCMRAMNSPSARGRCVSLIHTLVPITDEQQGKL